jgi:hypothetical protein
MPPRPARLTASAVVAALLLAACTLAPAMPPLDRGYLALTPSPAMHSGATSAPAMPAPPSPLQIDHDSTEDLSRISVMTHPGRYFLWIQQPQLTWFYVFPGMAPAAPPPEVFLVFRTQSPQSIMDNHLLLTCGDSTTPVPGLPTSRVHTGIQTSSHYLTFSIPTPLFLRFAGCASGALEVGGIRANFSKGQSAQLRTLAASW